MRLAGPERAFVKKSRRGLESGMRGKYPLPANWKHLEGVLR
jgi:hypothetical protein